MQDIREVLIFRLRHLYEWMVFASLNINLGLDLLRDNLVRSLSPPQDRSAKVMNAPRDKVMFFAGSMSSPRDHVNDGTGRGGAYVYYGNDTRYLIAAKV